MTLQTIEERLIGEYKKRYGGDISEYVMNEITNWHGQFIRQQFEELLGEIVGEKMMVCGCDEDSEGPGYHTKNCDMSCYGYNQAIDDFIQRTSDRGFKVVK